MRLGFNVNRTNEPAAIVPSAFLGRGAGHAEGKLNHRPSAQDGVFAPIFQARHPSMQLFLTGSEPVKRKLVASSGLRAGSAAGDN